MSELSRVAYDELVFSDDDFYHFDGQFFSGVGVERDESGTLVGELGFLAGRQHGPAREYYRNGRLKGETPYIEGVRHGVEREWSESGGLVEESTFEFDVVMESRRLDGKGRLIEHYVRPEGDALYNHVLECRSSQHLRSTQSVDSSE